MMTRILRLPKFQLLLTLLFIFITTVIKSPSILLVVHVLLVVVLTVVFDLLFSMLRGKNFFLPYAGLASGAIIALILPPTIGVFEVISVTGIGVAAKNFLRVQNRHIFNPAALGLLVAAVLFDRTSINPAISWWAVSWQHPKIDNLSSIIYYLLLLSPLYISGFRLKRYWTITAFLIATFVTNQLVSNTLSIVHVLDPTLIFFSIVMLPEPMTTPVNRNRQILFGLFVGIVSWALSSQVFNGIPDTLIIALLLGNLLFFRYR